MRITKHVITQYTFEANTAADMAEGLELLEESGVDLTYGVIGRDGAVTITLTNTKCYDRSTIHKMEE